MKSSLETLQTLSDISSSSSACLTIGPFSLRRPNALYKSSIRILDTGRDNSVISNLPDMGSLILTDCAILFFYLPCLFFHLPTTGNRQNLPLENIPEMSCDELP